MPPLWGMRMFLPPTFSSNTDGAKPRLLATPRIVNTLSAVFATRWDMSFDDTFTLGSCDDTFEGAAPRMAWMDMGRGHNPSLSDSAIGPGAGTVAAVLKPTPSARPTAVAKPPARDATPWVKLSKLR